METLQISPRILNWAADKSGLSLDELVDLLDKPQKHDDLVAGKFSITDAEKFAKKAHIPFGYLFLEQPPDTEQRTLPDLRQVPDHVPLSSNFFAVLDDVLRKQDWYLEYLQEQGAEKLAFVGKYAFSRQLEVEAIATNIVETLDLTEQERKQCKDYKGFFSLLSKKAEKIGILVFKSSIVQSNTRRSLSVNEFRGFAIADPLAPLIFINGKDSEAAWIFTLAHEIAHIWLGESGVSDIPVKKQPDNNKVEVLCNRIAAEILTPRKQFLKSWNETKMPDFTQLSKYFNVSQLVIARRAFDLGKINWQTYQDIAEKSKVRKTAGGGDAYRNYSIRNSKRFTKAIVTQAMSGHTMLREVASLLNVKPDTVMELSKRLSLR